MEKDNKFKLGVKKAKEFVKNVAEDSGPIVEIKFFPGKQAGDKRGAIIRLNKEPIKTEHSDHISVKTAKKLANLLFLRKNEADYKIISSGAKKAITGKDHETGIELTKAERAATLGFTAARTALEVYRVPARPVVKGIVLPQVEKRVMEKIKNPDK